MKRVLVIDDDSQVRKLLTLTLEKRDYQVFEAPDGFQGLQSVQSCRPDLILLDLNLPDMDGSRVLKDLRAWSSIPVIILSVRSSEADIVGLLNEGADDYLVKPFNAGELLARMQVVLRRINQTMETPRLELGNLAVDWDQRQVSLSARAIHLTPTEYSILAILARNPGRIITSRTLLTELWGTLAEVESGNLRVHVSAIRKKLGPLGPAILVTEPGIGYRLVDPAG